MSDKLRKRLLLALESVFFSAFFILILLITKLHVPAIHIFGYVMPPASFLGCLVVCEIICAVALTMTDWKSGSLIAFLALFASLINSLMSVIIGKNVTTVPGVLMHIAGIGIVVLLKTRLRIIDANNLFYKHMSVTDSLTGLKNRRGMREYMASLIEQKKPFYLLFIDLDNFKGANDSIGHAAGDTILQTVAERCSQIQNIYSQVCRNGGDEFVIIIPDRKDLNINEHAFIYLEKINEELFLADYNVRYRISASIGISHYPRNASSIDQIINCADTAMYEAKRGGKNRFVLFNKNLAEQTEHEKDVELQLRQAIEEKRLYLDYQPQFDTKKQTLRGFESLLRLKSINGNVIAPGDFIHIAEQSDLILEIDKYVLNLAMTQFGDIARQAKKNKMPFSISVNISGKHISSKTFVSELTQIMEKQSFPPECLEIEITESSINYDFEESVNTLKELNRLGVAIALDDFGTGSASISNLIRLPINLLKIDKSYIDALFNSQNANDYIDAIITMGHFLHCDIISEGVETEDQLSVLSKSQCDYIQGFVLGRPLSFKEACTLIKQS